MKGFVSLLHLGHLCNFRLSHSFTYQTFLLKSELWTAFFISASSGSIKLQKSFLTRQSGESSSADDLKQDDNDGNYQENVNETTHCIRGNQSQKP